MPKDRETLDDLASVLGTTSSFFEDPLPHVEDIALAAEFEPVLQRISSTSVRSQMMALLQAAERRHVGLFAVDDQSSDTSETL